MRATWSGLVLVAGLLAAPMAQGAVPIDEAAIAGAMEAQVRALLAQARPSTVACALVLVCGAAATQSHVLCETPIAHVVACAGGTAAGGGGASPIGLPGRADWSATSVCGGDCSDARSKAASCTWEGQDDAGCGVGDTMSHPAVIRYSLFGPVCVTYTVTSAARTVASVTTPVPVPDAVPLSKEVTASHSAGMTRCG